MVASEPLARSICGGIILVAAALMTIGLVAVASASASLEAPTLQTEFWKTPFGRQVVFAVLGFGVILLAVRIGHQPLALRPSADPASPGLKPGAPAVWLFLATLVCLVLVLIPGIGVERNGARRWLHFGGGAFALGFQPSELAKLTLVIFLAAFLSARSARGGLRSLPKDVLPAALAVGLCVGLVGTEDFGTAVLLAAVGGLMLLMAGARLAHLLLLAIPALAAFAALLLAKPYRLQRLTAFADIWADPQGEGYHPIQSLITIASGGVLGRGLGGGVQKYGYLPESRTDFVFAVWCEETGLLGALVVLLLFGLLLYLGTRAAAAAPSPFGRLLAMGVTLMVTLQAVMNIAVVTASAPTKGIALPLVSAGGSGIIFLGASVGLLAGVALRGCYGQSAASVRPGAAGPPLSLGALDDGVSGQTEASG